jgi:thiamine biosynthesis lipoprotein
MAPTRRRFLFAAGTAGFTGLGLWKLFGRGAGVPAGRHGGRHYQRDLQCARRTSRAFGTEVSLAVLHRDLEVARKALDEALGELDTVENAMSLYRPDSQLCRLNREGTLANPHPHLVTVLRRSEDLARRSNGAFDVTVQPLWELYFAAQKNGALPRQDEIGRAREKVNWRDIEVSDETIRFAHKGLAVTLNGIAQGFAGDCVMNVLQRHGIVHALVNTGEVGSLGCKENGQPWRVGIQHPRQADAYVAVADLRGRCLATSGDYAASFTPDRVHNHIFDPQTGGSPRHFSSVTVVAPRGSDADALSTAVFVLGWERGLELLEATRGAEMFCVRKDGSVASTKGFPEVQSV